MLGQIAPRARCLSPFLTKNQNLMRDEACRYCNRPLMRIDHYGEKLIGYIDCNRWGRLGDKKLIMEMLADDLEALRASVRQKQPPH